MKQANQRYGSVVAFIGVMMMLGACSSPTGTTPSGTTPSGISSTQAVVPATEGATGITPYTKFHGDFVLAQLHALPEKFRESPYGVIHRQEDWRAFWSGFIPYSGKGNTLPDIDFSSQVLVFFRNTQFYNRINLGTVNIIEGKAEIVSMETRSASPLVDKASIAMVVLNRADVTHLRVGEQLIEIP